MWTYPKRTQPVEHPPGLRDRTQARFPMTVQPACEGLDHWKTDTGYEGSLVGCTSPQTEHVGPSWIGNRKASILDMNFQTWLSQDTDVPHLVVVFGTIPQLIYYKEFVSHRDLMVDTDCLRCYNDEDNADWLALHGDKRVTWTASHGTYMRALLSPSAHSHTADRTPEMIKV